MAPAGIAIVAALAFWMPQASALAVACAAAAVGGGALIYAVANRKPWLGTWAGILWVGAAFLATLSPEDLLKIQKTSARKAATSEQPQSKV